ncbi:MAG: hypothetical protein ACLS48_09425 [[Eubacterium] siraeum]
MSEETDKPELKRRLDLNPDKRCVIVAGGSMGRQYEKARERLTVYGRKTDMQFVVICGK